MTRLFADSTFACLVRCPPDFLRVCTAWLSLCFAIQKLRLYQPTTPFPKQHRLSGDYLHLIS